MTSDKSSPANRPTLSAGEPCAAGACALAVTLCTANALVMLLTATSALLIALPGTRALLQEKLNLTTNPYTVAPMAGGLAIVTALLGGFFIYCATQMRRSPAFARAAAWGAMTQTALQIAMLIYMTMHGQLNHITLAVLTISLIVLCALIDLSTRAVRFPNSPAPVMG